MISFLDQYCCDSHAIDHLMHLGDGSTISAGGEQQVCLRMGLESEDEI
jgi:hypothetical protein